MFGIRYLKAPPTTHVFHYVGGQLKRQGAGLSFLYYSPMSTLVAVPLASQDAPFFFSEVTADYQAVTVQGQLTFRVQDPALLAGLFDLTVDPELSYLTEDIEKLSERLVHAAQVRTHTFTSKRPLDEILSSSDELGEDVLEGLRASEMVADLGVEVLGVSILQVKPTPETAKALEAEAREGLLRRSDEAIYARRNAAVEQERRIKESELSTQIAVEEKRRTIREKKMAADIAVETERAKLMDTKVQNERKEADARAYALEQTMTRIQDVDWRKLMLMGEGAKAADLIALAFQQLAENADKIGTLNVSPELLQSLTDARRSE